MRQNLLFVFKSLLKARAGVSVIARIRAKVPLSTSGPYRRRPPRTLMAGHNKVEESSDAAAAMEGAKAILSAVTSLYRWVGRSACLSRGEAVPHGPLLDERRRRRNMPR